MIAMKTKEHVFSQYWEFYAELAVKVVMVGYITPTNLKI